jgi:hypothetical protein
MKREFIEEIFARPAWYAVTLGPTHASASDVAQTLVGGSDR